MDDTSRYQTDPKKTEKVATILLDAFPHISQPVAQLQARHLVESPNWGSALHHNGAIDQKNLFKLQRSLQDASKAMGSLSEWSQTALSTILIEAAHNDFMTNRNQWVDLPNDLDEFTLAFDQMILAASGASDILKRGRAGNGKNWRAIAVVDDAQKLWRRYSGKTLPKRKLNNETKFARFLEELFEVLNIGALPSSAYHAWAEFSKDPESPMDFEVKGADIE